MAQMLTDWIDTEPPMPAESHRKERGLYNSDMRMSRERTALAITGALLMLASPAMLLLGRVSPPEAYLCGFSMCLGFG